MRSRPHARTQTLLRHGLFVAALLTYLVDPVDIVWRTVQHTAHPRAFERLAFGAAALLLLAAIALTLRHRGDRRHSAVNLLYFTAIAFLLPWEGALLLVPGQLLLLTLTPALPDTRPAASRIPVYVCALVAMTLFTLTLQDRLADLLFGATFLLALGLDLRPQPPR